MSEGPAMQGKGVPARDRISTGVAGEHFVCAELAKRGWVAALTAKNTPAMDVIATRLDASAIARIQVKTRSTSYRRAHRVSRIELNGPKDFVVLVDIGDVDESPQYWVVPAGVASSLIKSEQIRTSDIEDFRDRWDLLDEGQQ